MNIRAVLYDFDGTLIDSAESSYQCYVETFGRFGVPFDHETFQRTYSPNWLHTYAAAQGRRLSNRAARIRPQ